MLFFLNHQGIRQKFPKNYSWKENFHIENLEGETSAASWLQHSPKLVTALEQNHQDPKLLKTMWNLPPTFLKSSWHSTDLCDTDQPQQQQLHLAGGKAHPGAEWKHREFVTQGGKSRPKPCTAGQQNFSLKEKLLINPATMHLPPLISFPNLIEHDSSMHHHWSLCWKIITEILSETFFFFCGKMTKWGYHGMLCWQHLPRQIYTWK